MLTTRAETARSKLGLTILSADRPKRDSVFVPQTVTGWTVLSVAILCLTGVVVLWLGERDIAMVIFGGAGWGGFLTHSLARRK